jgi:hypothetical protein
LAGAVGAKKVVHWCFLVVEVVVARVEMKIKKG